MHSISSIAISTQTTKEPGEEGKKGVVVVREQPAERQAVFST